MKKVFLPAILVLIATASFAQGDKFQKGMERSLALLDSAKTGEDFTSVAASFERIGDAEKTQWLPYYYAALSNIWKGFSDPKANKDDVADKAESLIAKAEAMEPKNSDIALLKSMAATLHMIVDPQTRYMKYGAAISQGMAVAKQLDQNNPRVYYWEGQNLFGTPEQFGGGKAKAKPLFEKSLALYITYKPASSIYPNWGKSSAEHMLAQCQ